jgi:hypothetical protein
MSGIVGQNTLDNSGLIKAPSGGGGAWNFIAKQTASASADISFTSGIDSTYKEYVFTFNNMHPETEASDKGFFTFQGSTDGGSSYGVTITSSHFYAQHDESDSGTSLQYQAGHDLAQSTSFQRISEECGNDNDQCVSGYIHFFGLSDTTFVKHFICTANVTQRVDWSFNNFTAGYFNDTSAIDAIQFKFSHDAIDAGDICLYGIST